MPDVMVDWLRSPAVIYRPADHSLFSPPVALAESFAAFCAQRGVQCTCRHTFSFSRILNRVAPDIMGGDLERREWRGKVYECRLRYGIDLSDEAVTTQAPAPAQVQQEKETVKETEKSVEQQEEKREEKEKETVTEAAKEVMTVDGIEAQKDKEQGVRTRRRSAARTNAVVAEQSSEQEKAIDAEKEKEKEKAVETVETEAEKQQEEKKTQEFSLSDLDFHIMELDDEYPEDAEEAEPAATQPQEAAQTQPQAPSDSQSSAQQQQQAQATPAAGAIQGAEGSTSTAEGDDKTKPRRRRSSVGGHMLQMVYEWLQSSSVVYRPNDMSVFAPPHVLAQGFAAYCASRGVPCTCYSRQSNDTKTFSRLLGQAALTHRQARRQSANHIVA